MLDGSKQPVTLRRFYAVLALRGLTLATMARRCLVSDPHLRAVILGDRRPSQRLAAAIQAELASEAFGLKPTSAGGGLSLGQRGDMWR